MAVLAGVSGLALPYTHILVKAARSCPYEIIYSVCELHNSETPEVTEVVKQVIGVLRECGHSARIDNALMFTRELKRVASSWIEKWYFGIEEASRFWLGQRNFKDMWEVFVPLYESLNKVS